jgi:hypothetical protein
MPEFVEIFEFFERIFWIRRFVEDFFCPMWSVPERMEKSRIRQECENIKTCDLRDPR